MSRPVARPDRLVDLPSDQDLVGVTALVRAAALPPKEIAPATRQRIRGRLRGSLTRSRRGPRHRWRLALTLMFTLAAGGVVGAATHSVILKRWSSATIMQAEPAGPRPAKRRRAPAATSVAPNAVEQAVEQATAPAPPLAPVVALPPAATPAPDEPAHLPRAIAETAVSSQARSVPVAPAHRPPAGLVRAGAAQPQRLAYAGPSDIAAPKVTASPPPIAPTGEAMAPAEATVLAQAIRALRIDGNAAAALDLLDRHQARFRDGALAPEASAVRVEALLRLGRAQAALADLDRLPLRSMPRRDEWHVVRGELRAQAGRWSSAESDFSAALPGAVGDLAERALWGRVAARAQQGNTDGARVDAVEYLRRFPNGRFDGLARQVLRSP